MVLLNCHSKSILIGSSSGGGGGVGGLDHVSFFIVFETRLHARFHILFFFRPFGFISLSGMENSGTFRPNSDSMLTVGWAGADFASSRTYLAFGFLSLEVLVVGLAAAGLVGGWSRSLGPAGGDWIREGHEDDFGKEGATFITVTDVGS